MKEKTWKDSEGNFRRIDKGGNFFVGKRCFNPLKNSGLKITDYPNIDRKVYIKTVKTGKHLSMSTGMLYMQQL